MIGEKMMFSAVKGFYEWFKKKLRKKDENLKGYYKPYYTEIETVISKHLPVITLLNQEVTSFSSLGEEDMQQQMEEIEAHNNEVFDAAAQAAQGQSIKDMAREIDNLVTRLRGAIDESVIDSLEQYSQDLYEADNINEYHFLQAPCQNILNLTRDIKAKIPTVHSSSDVQ